MIVFDLKCGNGHVFEAWFASSEGFARQRSDGQLVCAVCGDTQVDKAVMAPAVGTKSNRAETGSSEQRAVLRPEDQSRAAVLAKLAELQARMLEGSTWVGDAFADRARAIHYGEEAAAPIHGVVDRDSAAGLIEEGIAVAPLPLPVVPPGKRH